MLPDRLLSIALGRPDQASGLILLERYEKLGAWNGRRYEVMTTYRVVGLDRVPRSDGYLDVAAKAAALWPGVNSKSRGVVLSDVSASGRAALEPMRDLGLRPLPIDLVQMVGARGGKRSFEVGQPELISAAAVVQAGEL